MSDLPETVDAAVLQAMTETSPGLVRALRNLVEMGQTNTQIITPLFERTGSATLMRNTAHCLDAIRRETQTEPSP